MSHHIYLKKNGHHKNFNPQYLQQLKYYTLELNKELPVLFSLKHLAILTDTPYHILYSIVHRTNNYYRVFPIAKRNGSKRWICVPSESLLKIQKWVNKEILSSEFVLNKISYNSTAYMRNKGHVFNANQHFGSNDTVKLDMTRFFESISERQVFHVFKKLGYKSYVSFILARVCTRVIDQRYDKRAITDPKRWTTSKHYKFSNSFENQVPFETQSTSSVHNSSKNQLAKFLGHLPQGAPTSPLLSNLVCINLDKNLAIIAEKRHLNYTRYADDLVFSGDIENRTEASSLIRQVSKALREEGFKVNFQKTKYCPRGTRQIITGICINDLDKIRIPKSYKDKIRQELHYIELFGVMNHCQKINISNPAIYLLRLEGKIRYIISIEKDIGERMLKKLMKFAPELHQIKSLLES